MLRLEVPELPLELAVRVQDLVRLDVSQPLELPTPRALEEPVADRDSEEGREQDEGPGERPGHGAPGSQRQRHHGRAGQAGGSRRPEPSAQRRVLPAHVPEAVRVPPCRAGPLDHPRARELPVGRIPLVVDPGPGADPPGQGQSRCRREPEQAPPAPEREVLHHPPPVHDRAGLYRGVDRPGAPEAHRVGARPAALLPRGLPVHEVVGEAPGPALLVRLAHHLLADPDHLVGHRERDPVVLGHEVVARAPRQLEEARHALGPDLALHVGEEPLREEAVDLGGHRQLTRASGRRMVNTAPHPGGLVTAISPPCRLTIS